MQGQEKAQQYLSINSARVIQQVIEFLQQQPEFQDAYGVFLGLSGGLDSAVLAALLVRAYGADRTHALYLHDRDSNSESHQKALLVADWLGISLQVFDMTPDLKLAGIYDPVSVRLTGFSAIVNRLLVWLTKRLLSASPLMGSMQYFAGELDQQEFKKRVYELVCLDTESGFNQRHRHRRAILEQRAETHQSVVFGAANRTEWMLGWFVRQGIDDLPVQPLLGLYKSQVRQLAVFLAVPEEIVRAAPSPDMLRGMSDEMGIGEPYWKADLALDYLDGGLDLEEILQLGVGAGTIDRIRELQRLSAYKRENGAQEYVVDGGAFGGFRLFEQPG